MSSSLLPSLRSSLACAAIVSVLVANNTRGDDQPLATLPTAGEARQVAFSPDGKLLAASIQNFELKHIDLVIFSYADRKNIKEFSNVSASFAFSPDGKRLAVGGLGGVGNIALFDTNTWKPGPQLIKARPDSEFKQWMFSPDNKQMVSATTAGSVELWDIASEQCIGTWTPLGVNDKPAAPISYLGFTPLGKPLVAVGIRDVIVRELEEAAKGTGPLDIGVYSVHVAALSPDGRLFVTAGVAEPRLFDLVGGKWKSDLKGVSGHTRGIAFTLDNQLIITTTIDCHGHKDGTLPAAVQVRVWDASTGKEVSALRGKLPEVSAVAAAPDGKTFVTGGDKEIDIWDLKKLTSAATPLSEAAAATALGSSPE